MTVGNEHEDSLDLRRLVRVGWSYRRVFLFAFACVLPLYILGVLSIYLLQPLDRFTAVQFEARFDGAGDGKYPNGLHFSEGDIVAEPVLKAVFDRNQLQRYVSFGDFKGAFFVIQSSPDRDVLDYEYKTKLAEIRLTTVDRRQLEEEYKRKRESLRNVGYLLNLRSSAMSSVPFTLQEKLMLDVLNEWATQAVERKGVLRYEINMPSAVLPPAASGSPEDFFSVVESLRRKAVLVMETVERVMTLPGASFVRAGELKVSLADIRSTVDDLVRGKIEPLASQVAGTPGVDRLIRDQLLHATIIQNQAITTLKSLEDALRDYDLRASTQQIAGPAGSPAGQGGQLNNGPATPATESFLDRLVELTNRASDEKYRQDFTTRILLQGRQVAELGRETEYAKGLLSVPRQSSVPGADTREASVRQIEKQLSDSIKDLEVAYEELSRINLNPSTSLFNVTGPVLTSTARAFGASQIVLWGVWMALVTILIVAVGCGLHALMSGRFDSEPRVA